jgi:hypothetical protein|tara:strand:+ start:84 stop:596 length:513 start_codon:yes stop_codon:yes gene_type:complete
VSKFIDNKAMHKSMKEFRANPSTENAIRVMKMSDVAGRGATNKVLNQCSMVEFYFKKVLYNPENIECIKPGYSVNPSIRLKDSKRTGIEELEYFPGFKFYPGAIKKVDELFTAKFPKRQVVKEQPKNIAAYGWTELYPLDWYDNMYNFIKELYESKRFDDIIYDVPKSAN